METATVSVSRRLTFARVGLAAILIGFAFVAGRLSAKRPADLRLAQEQAKPAVVTKPQAVPEPVEVNADLATSAHTNVADELPDSHSDDQRTAALKDNGVLYSQVYNVADLVRPTPNFDLVGVMPNVVGHDVASADFDAIIELITSTVHHETWLENGTGMSEIQPFPTNLSLVVTAPQCVHEEITMLFQQLRRLQYELPADMLGRVREVTVHKLNAPIPLMLFATQITPELQRQMSYHYDSALSQLTEEYGAPDQVTEAGNADFPEWATAQRIAVWNRPGGKLYFALQDAQPAGLALVTGWWEDSFGPLKPMRIAQESFVGAR